MGDVGPNPTRTTSLDQAMQVCNTDPPDHKASDEVSPQDHRLQLENSNLMRRVKELEQNPHPSEEEEQSATKGNTAETQSNQIRHFSRTYAYMVNRFITAKECAPSKDAKNYHPSQIFGTHRREGDFREFLDHLPEQFQDDLKDKDQLSLFTKTVEFPHRCHETMELTYPHH